MEVSGQLKLWPLYSEGNSIWYPLDKMLGEPTVGRDMVAKRNIPVLTVKRTHVIQPIS
jgi:hypothetical protein